MNQCTKILNNDWALNRAHEVPLPGHHIDSKQAHLVLAPWKLRLSLMKLTNLLLVSIAAFSFSSCRWRVVVPSSSADRQPNVTILPTTGNVARDSVSENKTIK